MAVLEATQLESTLADIIARMRDALSPVEIYLHGSYAYGTPHSGSDLDLVVVVEDSPLNPYDRDAIAYRALIGIGVPIDVQVYTRSEFEERAAWPVSFERTVKSKGRVVHGVSRA